MPSKRKLSTRTRRSAPAAGGSAQSAGAAAFARKQSPSLLVRQLRRTVAALQAENRALRAGKLRHAEGTRFRQVIDASPVPLSVDDLKGNIIYVNKKFEEKFGYSHAELPTSAAWFAHAYPNAEYRRQVTAQWKGILRKGLRGLRNIGPLEVEVTCKDGSRRQIEFYGNLVGDHLLLAAIDNTERERLEKEIIDISEQERERIGQDLHDGLCQLLSGIKFKTTLLEQRLHAKAAEEAWEARSIESLLNSAIEQARNIARGLHPVDIEARGLMSALEGLTASVSGVYGVRCACEFRNPVLIHDHSLATHLYRIAQEAIANAIKHGEARKISVRLGGRRGRFVLAIQDNGSGFPVRPRKKTGLGLHLMNYRARAIGATLDIRPASPAGTVVTCRFRVRPAANHRTL
jgi:PAS domain S-box-containing protein